MQSIPISAIAILRPAIAGLRMSPRRQRQLEACALLTIGFALPLILAWSMGR